MISEIRVFAKPLDEAFLSELVGREREWAEIALAGFTHRTVYNDFAPDELHRSKCRALAVLPPRAVEPWLFGHDFVDQKLPRSSPLCDPRFRPRIVLLDLLMGRVLRLRARERFEQALDLERRGVPREVVDETADHAVGMERLGLLSEQGLIFWGERLNREGLLAVPLSDET